MKEKKSFWIILIFPMVFIVFFIFSFIHELGHFIFIIITNTEFYRFEFMSGDSGFLTFGIYHNSASNSIKAVMISFGGIFLTFITLLIPLYISIKRRNLTFSVPILFYLLSELFYFGLSPLIRYGDSFNILTALNISNSLVRYIIPIVSFICCFILINNLIHLLQKLSPLYLGSYKEVVYV